LLSYVSTAVVSAASATSYGAGEFLLLRDYVFILTFVVLALFAVVTLAGIRESGQFAFGIFVTHCSVLSVLLLAGLISIIRDKGRTLYDNIVLSDEDALKVGSIGSGFGFSNLYFGVCSAMLGVTGFETSSNYIEDQKPNVFPKTLRNMWLMVTILNPMMGVVLLGVFTLRDIPGNEANLVNLMAEQLIGPTFRSIVAADAVLALSGGALTAYIGVNGLLVRMVDEGNEIR
jgi:amino acid transporter